MTDVTEGEIERLKALTEKGNGPAKVDGFLLQMSGILHMIAGRLQIRSVVPEGEQANQLQAIELVVEDIKAVRDSLTSAIKLSEETILVLRKMQRKDAT